MLKNLLNIIDKSISIEDKLINNINQSIDLNPIFTCLAKKYLNQIKYPI